MSWYGWAGLAVGLLLLAWSKRNRNCFDNRKKLSDHAHRNGIGRP